MRAQDVLDTDITFQKSSIGDKFVEERQKRGFIMMKVKVKHITYGIFEDLINHIGLCFFLLIEEI